MGYRPWKDVEEADMAAHRAAAERAARASSSVDAEPAVAGPGAATPGASSASAQLKKVGLRGRRFAGPLQLPRPLRRQRAPARGGPGPTRATTRPMRSRRPLQGQVKACLCVDCRLLGWTSEQWPSRRTSPGTVGRRRASQRLGWCRLVGGAISGYRAADIVQGAPHAGWRAV